MNNTKIFQCPTCGEANEIAANKCAYCGTQLFQPLPVRYILFGTAVGFLSALLLREAAISLVAGVSRVIGVLAMSTAAGFTAFWLTDIRYRQRGPYILGSLLACVFFGFLGVWRCWLPIIVFPVLLLFAPRIRKATRRSRTVLVVSYILFFELAVILILLRPDIFSVRPLPLWVSWLVAVLAAAYPVRVAYLCWRRDAILATWPLTTANILSVKIKVYYGSEDTTEMQYMMLQYPVAEKLVSSETAVNTGYATYEPGDAIQIRYDPDKPHAFIFADVVSAPLEDALFLFPLLIWASLLLWTLL